MSTPNQPPQSPPPPGYGYPGQPYGQPMVPRKEPALSLLVSFFVPGVGSMINGEVGKGVLILVGFLIGCLMSIILIGIPFAIGFWIWGMIDGYSGAVAFNQRMGYPG